MLAGLHSMKREDKFGECGMRPQWLMLDILIYWAFLLTHKYEGGIKMETANGK
jgi:hypothetical protein